VVVSALGAFRKSLTAAGPIVSGIQRQSKMRCSTGRSLHPKGRSDRKLDVTRDAHLMNRFFSILSTFAMLLSGCGTFNSVKADKRDFAIDTYYPPSNEIQLAEHHARQYWQKNASRVGTEPHYLAVTASSLLVAELSPEFSVKLDRSEMSGAYFTQGISSSSKQGVRGVMIFDTETDHAVGRQGYIIVDTPSRGQIVRVADYTARFIGSGG
jgi:hypothetical protein